VPSPAELRRHLAYEVHYLVHAAVRFQSAKGTDKVHFQDSALMHARNLLEFTKPNRPRWGWWITDVGGPQPRGSKTYERWNDLINAKVTHLGPGRLARPPWPVRHDDERLAALSRYSLKRILRRLPRGNSDGRVIAMRDVGRLGLDYLNRPMPSALTAIAELIDS